MVSNANEAIAQNEANPHRGLDAEKWQDLRKDMDFSETPPELAEQATDLSLNPGWEALLSALRIAGVVLLILLLVFLIVKLVLKAKRKDEKPNQAATDETEDVLPTALAPMDVLWKAFNTAKNNGDFREALRLLYQISIKRMGEANFIHPEPDKTNWEYVTELKDAPQAQIFAGLTIIYEKCWYGDESLSPAIFRNYEANFTAYITGFDDAK